MRQKAFLSSFSKRNKTFAIASISSLVAFSQVAQAANTIWSDGTTSTAAASGTWNSLTWTGGTGFPNSAGDIAESLAPSTTTATATVSLNTAVTIGGLWIGSGGTTQQSWTITSDGTHVFTIDGTGMTAANNPWGDAGVASLAVRSGGLLTISPNLVLASNVDIGVTSPQITSGNAIVINGNITASTGVTFNFKGSGTAGQANINGVVTINGNIGASGSAIAISNLRSSLSGTSGNVVISGNLGSSVTSLTQNGVSTMVLGGTNTYTGATTITSGTLEVKNGSAIPIGSAVTFANTAGATLQLDNSQKIGSLSGGGSTGGNVVLGANTLTTGGDNTSTSYAGVISSTGSGGLTKVGSGAQTLTGANTYAGATTVSGGVLYVNNGGGASYSAPTTSTHAAITATNTSSSGTGTGSVTVQSGSAIAGSGTIASSTSGVTIQSGGTLISGAVQSGTSAGQGLTINSNLSNALVVNGGATLTFALGSTTAYTGGSGALNFANPNTNSTFLSLTGSTVDQIFSNTSTADNIHLVDLTIGSPTLALTLRSLNPYLLIQTALGNNADFSNLVTTGGLGANGYVLGVGTGVGNAYTAFNLSTYDINGNLINSGNLGLYLENGDLEVVPEPGTWALMLGGLVTLVFWQRRKFNARQSH